MLVFKFICLVIAIFTTLLYISDYVTDLNTGPTFIVPAGNEDDINSHMKHAAIRLILSIIMSLTWPVVILL